MVVGHSILDRVLVAIFMERAVDRVRMMSARKATRRERKDHEENVGR
jgi:uncharacterized DUF497 family protein